MPDQEHHESTEILKRLLALVAYGMGVPRHGIARLTNKHVTWVAKTIKDVPKERPRK